MCVGVMVNPHITLLLDRPGVQVGASLFALKGVPDQGGGSLVAWSSLSKEPMVVCRPATPPGDPSRVPGIWNLFTFYN